MKLLKKQQLNEFDSVTIHCQQLRGFTVPCNTQHCALQQTPNMLKEQ